MSKVDTFRDYLQSVGRHALLSAAEEVELGKKVRAMVALEEKIAAIVASLDFHPTDDELAGQLGVTIAEFRSILRDGKRAQDRMVEANLRLVINIAKKYTSVAGDLSLEELIQYGNIGLIQGIRKFDPTKGYKLSTYAYWWIRQGVTRAIQDHSRLIRVPTHVYESVSKLRKMQAQAHIEGRTLGLDEVCKKLKKEPDTIGLMRTALLKIAPLNVSHCDGGEELIDRLSRFGPDSEIQADDLTHNIFSEELLGVLKDALSPAQYTVISLRFGLEDGESRTLAQIGSLLGVTRERVRQIQNRALYKLRQSKALRGFAEIA